jgi:hypothetical protein
MSTENLFLSQRKYLLNAEQLTSVDCPLHAVFHMQRGPVPKDAETHLLLQLQIFNLSVISIAVLKNVSLRQGYRNEPPFQH